MDEERRKAKRHVIGLFFLYLCIAFVCFGVFAYILTANRGNSAIDERTVTLSKIIVMIGIFFLVMAFGYVLPVLISNKKVSENKREFGMSEILNETNMRQTLEKYIPNGETLLAGIHAVSKEMKVMGVFEKCVCKESSLIPNENGGIVVINKKKYSAYDVYIGITQYSLVIAECEKNKYLYQFGGQPIISQSDIKKVTSEIFFEDIGTCFPLTDIQNFEMRKGWMGSVRCFIKFKNESYFKLILPKSGGLDGYMPHYKEYREAIIAQLTSVV